MIAKLKIKQNKFAIFSLFIYVLSLTQTAFKTTHLGLLKSHSSIELLIGGGFAFLGGGFFESIIWLANPLYFLSILSYLESSNFSIKTSIFASILSLSFLFWTSILGSESGSMVSITSHNIGYWLW